MQVFSKSVLIKLKIQTYLLPDHGPIMLSWMLAHYLIDEDFGRFRNLGERAVQVSHADLS